MPEPIIVDFDECAREVAEALQACGAGTGWAVTMAVSPDFDAYAGGQIDAAAIRCVLCGVAPCGCPPFGTPEYLALVDRLHGRGGSR